MSSKRTPAANCMIHAIVIGAIVGWVVGVAQMAYMNSAEFFFWPLMLMFPAYNALGFAFYGMILGGSGLFTSKTAEAQAEEPQKARVAGHAA